MNKESRVMLPLRLLEAKVEATNKALCDVSDKRHLFFFSKIPQIHEHFHSNDKLTKINRGFVDVAVVSLVFV